MRKIKIGMLLLMVSFFANAVYANAANSVVSNPSNLSPVPKFTLNNADFGNLKQFLEQENFNIEELLQTAVVQLSCVTITYSTPESVNALQQIAQAGYMSTFLAYAEWFWCQGGRCEVYPSQCAVSNNYA